MQDIWTSIILASFTVLHFCHTFLFLLKTCFNLTLMNHFQWEKSVFFYINVSYCMWLFNKVGMKLNGGHLCMPYPTIQHPNVTHHTSMLWLQLHFRCLFSPYNVHVLVVTSYNFRYLTDLYTRTLGLGFGHGNGNKQ